MPSLWKYLCGISKGLKEQKRKASFQRPFQEAIESPLHVGTRQEYAWSILVVLLMSMLFRMRQNAPIPAAQGLRMIVSSNKTRSDHNRHRRSSALRTDRTNASFGLGDTCTEYPPLLLTGEDSVSWFLWWSHFGALRSYDGAGVRRIADLLAGALLYADGHSAPTCSSVLGHHKVIPDSGFELDYPVAVISTVNSRHDARLRHMAPRSDKQHTPAAKIDSTVCANEGKQHPPVEAGPSFALAGAADPKPKPTLATQQRATYRRDAAAAQIVPRVESFSQPLVAMRDAARLALVREILLIKEGSPRLVANHAVAAMSIVLSAGPAVGVPSDIIEADVIVQSVLGCPSASRAAPMVPADVFIAMLVALAATKISEHHALFECIRTCMVCGVVFPAQVARNLSSFLSRVDVGHINAAARMRADLFLEVDNFPCPDTALASSSLSRRLLTSKITGADPRVRSLATHSTACVDDQKYGAAAVPEDSVFEDSAALCDAVSSALNEGSLSEAGRLLDEYVPCLVPPTRPSLLTAIHQSRASHASKTHLYSVLRQRCNAVERFGFDKSLARLLASTRADGGQSSAAAAPKQIRKRSKLQSVMTDRNLVCS